MSNPKPMKFTYQLGCIELSELAPSIEKLVGEINDAIAATPGGDVLKFSLYERDEYPYHSDELTFYYEHTETDEEMNRRLEEEESKKLINAERRKADEVKKRLKQEIDERHLYERLKEKYGQ